MCNIIKLMILYWLTIGSHQQQLKKLYKMPSSCKNDEFFETVNLECQKCSEFSTQWTKSSRDLITYKSSNLIKSPDGLKCECKSGHFRVNIGKLIQCNPCPPRTVTSFDGLHCSLCSSEIPFQEQSAQCSPCSNNSVIDDKLIFNSTKEEPFFERYCRPCSTNFQADIKSNKCIPCHPSLQSSCSCPRDYFTITYDGMCLPTDRLLIETLDLYMVKYDNDEQVKSSFFANNLQSSHYLCKYQQNTTACQILANLCVLLNYNFFIGLSQNLQSTTNACNEILSLSKLSHVPSIIYPDIGVNEIGKINAIKRKYKMKTKINLIAARYNALGELKDLSPLKSGELQLCKSDPRSMDAGFYFGTNYEQKCNLNIQNLWPIENALLLSSPESTLFYDLYIIDDDQVSNDSIYSIPILVTNLAQNGIHINRDEDSTQWRLVRRFYLVEALTGIEMNKEADKELDSQSGEKITRKVNFKFIRYAKSITMNIKMSKSDGKGSIYPPWLTITYGLVSKEDYIANIIVPIQFKITYTMDYEKANRDYSICLGVFCGVAILTALFRSWTWAKRQGKQAIDPLTIVEYLVLSCGYIADAFLLATVGFAIHWFLVYKLQSVVHGLLPETYHEANLSVYLIFAFILKAIRLIHDMIILSHVDIFLIDWERPKNTGTTFSALKSRSEDIFDHNLQDVSSINGLRSNTPSSITGLTGKSISGQESQSAYSKCCSSVSIWRTFFIANEWIELCTYRHINMDIHFFMLILLLQSFAFINLSTADPENHLTIQASQMFVPQSSTCRLAIISITYICLVCIQLFWKRIITEKLFKNKLNEFVDLCSVANVSLFCLIYARFGYYIHGRSPNGRSDVNMKEMVELLRREEEDLCSKRGLLPNSDQQTFEMFLPSSISAQCKRIRALLSNFSPASDRIQSMTGSSGTSGGGGGGHLSYKNACIDTDKTAATFAMLTKFLSGFLEHVYKEIDYIIKDKSNIELILNFETGEQGDRGYFYNGN